MLCSVISEKGLRFNVKLVKPGERYGREDCLVHQDQRGCGPLVEFYDARYTEGFEPIGQFVTRYYAVNLLEESPAGGLCLDGGVADWAIDAVAFEMVRRFIRAEVE